MRRSLKLLLCPPAALILAAALMMVAAPAHPAAAAPKKTHHKPAPQPAGGHVYPIQEGLIDAHGVLIYYKTVGRGAPLLIVHDWIWRKRGDSRVVSIWLLKRINLVCQ